MSLIYQKDLDHLVLSGSDTWVGILDGNKLPTMDSFYEGISSALNFPDYFGQNLDALDELLFDFEWIQQQHVLLIVQNSDQLLHEETVHKPDLLGLLREVENPSFEIIFL